MEGRGGESRRGEERRGERRRAEEERSAWGGERRDNAQKADE